MTEFMALKPKLYAYKTFGGSWDKRWKGLKDCIMKKMLDFKDYKQCLLAGWNAFRKQLLFQSKLHKIHTVEVNKLASSRDDDKQVIQSDGMSTLAHGYKEASATDFI